MQLYRANESERDKVVTEQWKGADKENAADGSTLRFELR